MCVECYNMKKSEHISSKEELNQLIHAKTFAEIGKEYSVSGNAVRKWCKKYNLPYRKIDI